MKKWWESHFKLLIKSGLNKKDLEKVILSDKIKFREGALNLLDFLHEKNIPLVIMSSSGLGEEPISMILKKEKRMYDNIHIISNSYIWDKNGNAIGVREPIIHCINKTEIALQNYPVYEIIKNRKNVLLLGDGLGDIGMIEGFHYKNLIKIGFLNEEIDKLKDIYKKSFDAVILNDGSMDYVNKLLKEIIND